MFNCEWDQRIPNNPIFNRSFLLAQPPMVLFERPVSTYGTAEEPVGMVNLATRMPQPEETRMINYWLLHTANPKPTGLLTNPKMDMPSPVKPGRLAGIPVSPVKASKFPGSEVGNPAQPILEQDQGALLEQYPTRPWQQGVTFNINAENSVKSYELNVHKDTIPFDMEVEFTTQRMITDARARANMEREAPTDTTWNQPTSLKMSRPVCKK
jgi:hypothetical protein